MRQIEIVEYGSVELAADALSREEIEVLWRRYDQCLELEFPSPRTSGRFRLTANSSVGFFPVSPELGVAVRPKLDVRSVFAMLEYVHRLQSFRVFDAVHECATLDEIYERIVRIYASRVRRRIRHGLYREYRGERERLPFVRGRLDIGQISTAPWRPDFACRFEEHTPDVEDNQLLLWALHVAARSGIRNETTSRELVAAHRSVVGPVALVEKETSRYRGRRYSRLNDDYLEMHALARFIVEHAGPRHVAGQHSMVSFVVDMNRLFEQFVGEWLAVHLPETLCLGTQEHLPIGTPKSVPFYADLVIRERANGRTVAVLDTKYKRDDKPSASDVAQVVAYANAWGTNDAVLVYPRRLEQPWSGCVGGVTARTVGFPLELNITEGGAQFLAALATQETTS
jgi:5-methylcytosine-specific restriction enzyme subunit McrC